MQEQEYSISPFALMYHVTVILRMCMRGGDWRFITGHVEIQIRPNCQAALAHATWWQRCQHTSIAQPNYPIHAPMANFRVPLPEPFDFSTPDEWPKWLRCFQRFRMASGLASEEEETQVNTMIYCMGDKADDILRSFQLSAADKKSTMSGKNSTLIL